MDDSKRNKWVLKFDELFALLGKPVPVDKVESQTIKDLLDMLEGQDKYSLRMYVTER